MGQFDRLLAHVRGSAAARSVRAVRNYFDELPEDAARKLAYERADDVGELNGVPFPLRFLANHLVLEHQRDMLARRLRSAPCPPYQRAWLNILDDALAPVAAELGLDDNGKLTKRSRPRQFLNLPRMGTRGAVEVLGNLRDVDHILVHVGGTVRRLDPPSVNVDRLEPVKRECGPGVGLVLFHGYDFPRNYHEAHSTKAAQAAVDLLDGFIAALDVETPGIYDKSLMPYSYGNTVVVETALAGVPLGNSFKKLTLIASPGVDPRITSAADFGVEQVFAMRAIGDPVAYAKPHGQDPVQLDGVIRLATGDVKAARGHFGYFRANTESVRNISRVATDRLSAITTTDTTPQQETALLGALNWAAAASSPVLRSIYTGYKDVGDLRAVWRGHRAPRAAGQETQARPGGGRSVDER